MTASEKLAQIALSYEKFHQTGNMEHIRDIGLILDEEE